MPIRPALVLSAVLLSLQIASAADWPQFRGPTGQGTSEATNIPIEWSPAKNVAWSVEIPGEGWSSPVLSAGKIYLTSGISKGKAEVQLNAICLDAASGQVLWTTEPIKPAPGTAFIKHGKNTLASATPIVTDDRLYCHFGHMGTTALDLKGNVIWRQSQLKYMPVHGNGGSPTLLDGKLIFSCDGLLAPYVACLDAASGDIKWKVPRNSPTNRNFSFSTPLAVEVDGATQVVIPGSGLVAAYEPDSGREIWRVLWGDGYSVVPRPVFSNGRVFCSSGFDAAIVYAIDPHDATGDVTKSHVLWTQRKAAPKTPSLLALGDEVYFVSDDGILTCADAKSGKAHWTHRLNGAFSASPVAAEGRIYLQNEAGVGYVVKADPAAFEQLAENDLEERSLASYAVDDGCLYIRTEHHLWKITGK
jgi:outer membrane protein assembly factor BamB